MASRKDLYNLIQNGIARYEDLSDEGKKEYDTYRSSLNKITSKLPTIKTTPNTITVGKGIQKPYTPPKTVQYQPSTSTAPTLGQSLLKLGGDTVNAFSSLANLPNALSVAGSQAARTAREQGKGLIGQFAEGLTGTIKGGIKSLRDRQTVSNTQAIENIAPNITNKLKTNAPELYKAASGVVDAFDVTDLTGIGLVGDLAKLKKSLPTTKKLIDVSKEGLRLTKITKSIPEKSPVKTAIKTLNNPLDSNVLKIKNTRLDAAIDEYNQAIEAIQNTFKTSELRANEVPLIKSQLGIDLESLVKNIEDAQKGADIRKVGEQNRLAQAAGLKPQLKINLGIRNTIPSIENGVKSSTMPLNEINKSIGTNILPNKKMSVTSVTNDLSDNIGNKPRQFINNSVMNSEVIPEQVKNVFKESIPTYKPQSNKEQLEIAMNKITQGTAEQEWKNIVRNGLRTGNDTALGEALIFNAVNNKDYEKVGELTMDLAEALTDAGRAVQAASILKRMTPEGMLQYAQRQVIKHNQTVDDAAKKIQLTPDDSKYIVEQMQKVAEVADGNTLNPELKKLSQAAKKRVEDVELAKVTQFIANKFPSAGSEKFKALQRISLLLNPKTMVRNTLGNAIFATVDTIKDVPGAIADIATTGVRKLAGDKTAQRTTLIPTLNNLGTQFKGGAKGIKDTLQDAKLGIDTSITSGQYELPTAKTFKNPVLNTLGKATKTGLQLGDRPFFQAAYDESLRQQMKINKVTEPTQNMIDQAIKIAEQKTYQDANAITQGFKQLQQGLNNLGAGMGLGTKNFGVGNIVLPFTKTPANILKRAVEYTPLGAVEAFAEAFKGNKFDQKKFVDLIGRSVTGTSAILLAYDLAKEGLLTGKPNKDKDVAAMERLAGKSSYAYKIGDTYHTFDWAQPISIPMAIGADIFEEGKSRKEAANIALEALKSGGSTLMKQSLLQGVQRLFGGFDPVGGIIDSALNAPTQLVPTLAKQSAQLQDATYRETYDPNAIKQMINQIKAKIPGLAKELPARKDVFGRDMKQFQGNNSVFNVMFNPGFSTKYNPEPASRLVLDIYEKSGETIQFPRVASKNFTYTDNKTKEKKTVQLSTEQYGAYQEMLGNQTLNRLNQLALDKNFKLLKPELQAKRIQSILTDINSKVKKQIEKQYFN